VLPVHPEPAVSWHSGFGEEPMLNIGRRQFVTVLGGLAQSSYNQALLFGCIG
jgi:hypothetical protein